MKSRMLAASISVVALSSAVLAQGFTQVATAKTTGPQVTITFYEAMASALGKELTKLTNQFEAKNPTIQVNLVLSPTYTAQQQKLTAALAAGTPPTIAQVQDSWEQQFVDDGILIPLGDKIPKSTLKDLQPVWIADNTFNGKMYSVPFNKSDYVLYYNTDDFKAAGITEPPKTWTELEADAKKLTTSSTFGLGIQPNYYTFEMFLRQAGGTDLKSDNKTAAFNNAAGNKALSFMTRLVSEKAATAIGANAYLSDGFNTNAYAMALDTVASMTYITNKHIHYATAPLPMGKTMAVPTAGTNIAMFKGATPEQQAAALKYIDFLLSPSSTIDWAENTGYLPILKSDLTNPGWIRHVTGQPHQAVGPTELKYAFFGPRNANFYSAMQQANTYIANAVAGTQSVSDALSSAANAVTQGLSQQ